MKWMHIHIEGQVQGVGFRPFVFQLAHWLDLRGWVRNDVDGVHIEVGGSAEQLELFQYLLKDDAPAEAHISKISSYEIEEQNFKAFEINESRAGGKPNLLITPDLGLCEQCKKEIHEVKNSRYHYPFTTCTHCGPRYSIIQSLPYDRHTTSMQVFAQCPSCEQEYNNPRNRRYYSQTNSCPQCSIKVKVVSPTGKELADSWNDALPLLLRAFEQGKTIAIKGIGGYLLMTDATNAEAVKMLRERKHRPYKPFALMYPDIQTLRRDVDLSDEEEKAFLSVQSPVVLVKAKQSPASNICVSLIAPGLNNLGVMQPYTAMFELLLKAWKKPVVATSGNITGSPILYRDEEAFESLTNVADLFLMHNREIQIAQDDSVIRFAPKSKKRIFLRRSRGFAPTYLKPTSNPETILAAGADMKSSFALQANGLTYISQYLGDLESYLSQQYYKIAQQHLLKLLEAKPARIVIDNHPQYFSSELGKELARQENVPVQTVQHHEAHAWSVLAENDLIDSVDPVLCVVWDGTGYGTDRNIWGGEFFRYEKQQMKRIAHLENYPVWMGDRMALEPRLSALFLCSSIPGIDRALKPKFTDQEWNYYTKITSTEPPRLTSSMGRIFDAVSSLIGLVDTNTFEGQAAMYLETLAATTSTTSRYEVKWNNSKLNVHDLMDSILRDVGHKKPPAYIAFKFHAYLADVIYSLVKETGINRIAFSGGAFQNAFLVDLIVERFKSEAQQLYFHRDLSPNDENISFGQLACVNVRREEKQYSEKETVTNYI